MEGAAGVKKDFAISPAHGKIPPYVPTFNNPYSPVNFPEAKITEVKFDHKRISEEERAKLGHVPASSGGPALKSDSFAKPHSSHKDKTEPPPPPMRSEYPSLPDRPPISAAGKKSKSGVNYTSFHPTVWGIEEPFYDWGDPKVEAYPQFPLPKGWASDHMNVLTPDIEHASLLSYWPLFSQSL